jgi:hypothetical protein
MNFDLLQDHATAANRLYVPKVLIRRINIWLLKLLVGPPILEMQVAGSAPSAEDGPTGLIIRRLTTIALVGLGFT